MDKKLANYSDISTACIFQPLALETHTATHTQTPEFLNGWSFICNIRRYPWNIVSVATDFHFNSVFQCNFNQSNVFLSRRSKHQTSRHFIPVTDVMPY